MITCSFKMHLGYKMDTRCSKYWENETVSFPFGQVNAVSHLNVYK